MEPSPRHRGRASFPRRPRSGSRHEGDLRPRLAPRQRRTRWSSAGQASSTPAATSTASTTWSSATARSPSWPRPGEASVDDAEVVDAEGMHVFPAFFDPHVHLRDARRRGRRGHRDRVARGRGRRLLRDPRDGEHQAAGRSRRPTSRRCASAPATEASVPVGFLATVTMGMEGSELTEMAELRDAGAVGFSDDGAAGAERPRDAPGALPTSGSPAFRSPCTRRTPSSPARA